MAITAFRAAPFALALLLFLGAGLINFSVETVQSNGLRMIFFPYGMLAFFLYLFASVCLLLGVVFNLAIRAGKRPRPAFVASLFIALGVILISLVGVMFWLAGGEYALRCAAILCQPFVQQYLGEVTQLLIVAFGGLISTGIGSWLLVHKNTRKGNFSASCTRSPASGLAMTELTCSHSSYILEEGASRQGAAS